MLFELLPILDTMIRLYQKPRNRDRFRDYLLLLQGNSQGELELPIAGYNPMAKEHVLEKLIRLKEMKAEELMEETLQEMNQQLPAASTGRSFRVVINLYDDLKGAWTHRYTSDYDSKFRTDALVKRNFCTPVLWTSENHEPSLIRERTMEYACRTVFQVHNPQPQTLEDHVRQEVSVARKIRLAEINGSGLEPVHAYYEKFRSSKDYVVIFNFFYGDEATTSLGNDPLGIQEEFAGFRYARWLASQ